MNIIQRIENWGTENRPAWLDYVRIALGILIFSKGISFISDFPNLLSLINGSKMEMFPIFAIHCVAFAHLVGGILIAFGLVTRFAAVVQIPILFAAVFFVNIRQGFSFLNSELWLSIITLLLLTLFWIVGSGKYSADVWVNDHKMK
jgi:putative oxidoreductase